MAKISITHEGGSRYVVSVEEDDGSTSHHVNVSPPDVARYAPGARPEALLRASFEFLLAHEPKEAILRRFELPIIERYFPEYGRLIGAMVARVE